MIKDFFIDKFEYDFECNRRWCNHLLKYEDELSDYVRKSMSHIINVHHIWISRVLEVPSESGSWDILPIDYWTKLSQENYLKTVDYLEVFEFSEKVNYHTEEGVQLKKSVVDILYHILNHSNYHRAQISRALREENKDVPAFNFISFR